jgi:glycosyltransferase involved in cell wall biosynthesis
MKDGRAVILGEPSSIFVSQMAHAFRERGLDCVVITEAENAQLRLPDATPVVRSKGYETQAARIVRRGVLKPVLSTLDLSAPLFKQRFLRSTGVRSYELWMPYLASYTPYAWRTSRAALAQHPQFVLGQEVTAYGLSTALCRGVPRVLVPWGGDVFAYAESSPFQFALTKLSLNLVDLIVSTSTTAARHIVDRFRISPEKVQALSWGVDRTLFVRAEGEERRRLREHWRIDPNATVFLNARRFRPAWGGFVALEAFMRLAKDHPATHFILLGGLGTSEFVGSARERLAEAELLDRFTLLDEQVPIEVCAELMSISDVFLSLLGRGDLRSASVLQAAQAGGVPVISDLPEYREIERLGFRALFVDPDSDQDVFEALELCLRDPGRLAGIRERNERYLRTHEDRKRQMDRLVELIEDLCRRS